MMATQVISEYEDYVNLEVEKVTTSRANIVLQKNLFQVKMQLLAVSENGGQQEQLLKNGGI